MLVLEDPDEWVVREASAPTKLTCCPPDVEVASITAQTEPVVAASEAKPVDTTAQPVQEAPAMAAEPFPCPWLADLIAKYPPLRVKATEPDDWF